MSRLPYRTVRADITQLGKPIIMPTISNANTPKRPRKLSTPGAITPAASNRAALKPTLTNAAQPLRKRITPGTTPIFHVLPEALSLVQFAIDPIYVVIGQPHDTPLDCTEKVDTRRAGTLARWAVTMLLFDPGRTRRYRALKPNTNYLVGLFGSSADADRAVAKLKTDWETKRILPKHLGGLKPYA